LPLSLPLSSPSYHPPPLHLLLSSDAHDLLVLFSRALLLYSCYSHVVSFVFSWILILILVPCELFPVSPESFFSLSLGRPSSCDPDFSDSCACVGDAGGAV